jgi:hypothetical protein
MRMVTKLDGLLANTSEQHKNGTVTTTSILLVCCCSDSIWSKALQCMSFEVRCGCTILGILIASNATTSFAFLGGTFKVVILSSVIVSDLNGDAHNSGATVKWEGPACELKGSQGNLLMQLGVGRATTDEDVMETMQNL